MSSLTHDLELVAANVAVVATIAFLVVAVCTGVRMWCGRIALLRALREGHPRRYRAIARIMRRLPLQPFRCRLGLLDAFGLCLEGAFDRALTLLEPFVRDGQDTRIWPLAVLLKVECLIGAERYAEARSLLTSSSGSLCPVASSVCPGADEESLDAILLFHEGQLEASRIKLDAALARVSVSSPVARTLHFYSAAVVYRLGQPERTRSDLSAAISRGGDLFITAVAARACDELFPGLPAIPRGSRREKRRSPGVLATLFANLGAGIRLLSLRRQALRRAPLTYDQTIWLVLANVPCLGLVVSAGYWPGAMFLPLRALALLTLVFVLMLTVVLATWALAPPGIALSIAGRFYSALPLLLVLEAIGRATRTVAPFLANAYESVAAAWSVALFVFLVRGLTSNAKHWRLLGAAAVFAITWLVPLYYVAECSIWVHPPTDTREDTMASETKAIIAESAFAQADLVHSAEDSLAPERPGVTDLYFVGFAGWGLQDVFLNEISLARILFDKRFDTLGHSLLLSNDRTSRATLPMATVRNLEHVLKAIGSRMNREEDVLFLLMTSHGSEKGLSVWCSDIFLCEETVVSPTDVRKLLDEAGIKWRVLVISGCRSGVFVDPLKNDETLVATASASDKVSYGCGKGRQLTEFGRAVFAEQLVSEKSFATAFAKAADVVKKRETRKGHDLSEPQLFVGSAIAEKLHSLESRVADVNEAVLEPIAKAGRSADVGDFDDESVDAWPDAEERDR